MPRLGVFLVLVVVFFAVIVLVEVVIFVIVVVVDGMLKNVTARHFVTYALDSAGAAAGVAAGAATGAAAGFGGGYVVQKWRPQLLQTQNWSGVQGVPSPGSRISISAPQR